MAVLLTTLLMVAGAFVVLRLRPRNAAMVEAGAIIRSGRLTPRTLRMLARRHGLKTIVDLGSTPPGSEAELRMIAAARELGLKRVSIRGLYGTGKGNPNAYVRALRELTDGASLPALVQCAAGADRTGACVALYRHLARGEGLDAALAESARYGHDAARNPAMHAFVREHAAAIGEALRSGVDIAGYPPADAMIDPTGAHRWRESPATMDVDARVSQA